MTNEEPDNRQAAARLAARCQLRDLRAVSVQMDLAGQRDPSKQLTFAMSQSIDVAWDPEEAYPSTLVIEGSYEITLALREGGADAGGAGAAADEELASMSFALQSLYTIEWRDGDQGATQEEVEAFAQTTGAFALYPFAREWAHDLTGRMGLPPLTLPLLAVATTGLDGAAD